MTVEFNAERLRPSSPHFGETHHALREQIRRFVATEIAPNLDAWDADRAIPRELHYKAAALGILQLGYPERYGGVSDGIDMFHKLVRDEEIHASGSAGVSAALLTHGIGLPPIIAKGSDDLKQRVAPGVLAGEKLIGLAITEPSGGSDVASVRTKAVRDGDHFVVNGSKTYITSGMRADYLTTAVRTGGPGRAGVSLLLIETNRDGIERTALEKMGWHCSDTASISFNDVRVPVDNLVGAEIAGFSGIMSNFNEERLSMSAGAVALSRVCLSEAADWALQRETFGKRLVEHQVVRHKLAEMLRQINATQAYLENCAWRVDQGERPVADLALLKVQATMTMEFCAREALQILGGAGYMRGNRVERIYREVRVQAIGGGSEEIMRDLAARQMGL